MSELELSALDLRELERLEKKTLSDHIGFTPGLLHLTYQELDTVTRQLRPLINEVERMGQLLIDIRAVNFTRTNGLGDIGLEQRTDALIQSFKRAKGEL